MLALVLAAASVAAAHLAPPAIARFLDRREGCEHWSGEEPYDKARAAEIAEAETRLRCDRLEADEKALRRRFAGMPEVLRALARPD